MRARVLFALMLGLLSWGLIACGDDAEESASEASTLTAPVSPEEEYATALRDAASAAGDLASTVVSGDDPEAVATSIRSNLERWESAVEQAEGVELSDGSLADQRDALVEASPEFVDAWEAVADEWSTGAANGVLELVQRRSAIAGGVTALSGAVEEALQSAGEEARERLEGVADQLDAALQDIRSRK